MPQKFFAVCLFLLLPFELFAQNKVVIDSLVKLLPQAKEDTSKVRILTNLALENRNSDITAAVNYAKQGQQLATKLKDEKGLANVYRSLGIIYQNQSDFKKSVEYYSFSLEASKKINYKQGIAAALAGLGLALKDVGKFEEAIKHMHESIKILGELRDSRNIALNFNNIGLVYYNKGDYNKAIDYYLKALKTNEESNNLLLMAINYNSIGLVYEKQKNHERALESYQKALNINEKTGNKVALASNYNNIGIIYEQQKKYPLALESYQKALKLNEELNRKSSVAINLTNMGNVYKKQGLLEGALENYVKALPAIEASGKKANIAMVMSDIGDLYYKQKKQALALEYTEKALKIAQEIKIKEIIKEDYELLAKIYAENNNFEKAYQYKELFVTYNDSIYNENIAKEIANLQSNYDLQKKQAENLILIKDVELQKLSNKEKELLLANQNKALALEKEQRTAEQQQSELLEEKRIIERKQAEISLLNKEKELKELIFKKQQEKERADYDLSLQRIIIYALAASLIPVGLWLYTLYSTNKKRKQTYKVLARQNAEISQKNDEISQINDDLLESISYARRIQRAVLPSDDELKQFFEQYFIFYKPKDIVAGDFYWLQKIDTQKVIFALVDCTGHGVPGAFMSMIGNQILYDIVVRDDIFEPNIILDKLHEEITRVLKQEETHNNDGMDITLIKIDWQTQKLDFAAAKMGMCLSIQTQDMPQFKKNNHELWQNPKVKQYPMPQDNFCFMELKGDAMPIGGSELKKRNAYKQTSIQLTDTQTFIYMYSDGYADQFGGNPIKKFFIRDFKILLQQISLLNFDKQEITLEDNLNRWTSNYTIPQTDDILVVGLKINF